MEPRWTRTFGKKFEFVGGTRKVDIYVNRGVAEVRFVWGPDGAHSWHWVSLDREKGCIFLKPSILQDEPTKEEMQEAYDYMKLFAPWALEGLK